MPAALIHVALALIALNGPFSYVDKKDFIVGTSFPDIRYPAGLPRNKTHVNPVVWGRNPLCQTSFQAGYLFHSWVDLIFEDYMEQTGLPTTLAAELPRTGPTVSYALQTLKILADKALYPEIASDLQEIPAYFKKIHPEETAFGVERALLREWHNKLARYTAGTCFDPHGDFCLAKSNNAIRAKIAAALAVMANQGALVERVAHDFYRFAREKIGAIRLPVAR